MTKYFFDKFRLIKLLTVILVIICLMTGCKSNATSDSNANAASDSDTNVGADTNADSDLNADTSSGPSEYEVEVALSGGSGKATILSPARAVEEEGKIRITLQWSSPNYDYMVVNGEKYLPVNTEGNSTFEIVVDSLDPIQVVADTIAMSAPHEIEYELSFSKIESSGALLADASKAPTIIGAGDESGSNPQDTVSDSKAKKQMEAWSCNHQITGTLDLKYAEKFSVTYYDGKYTILEINGQDYYLLTAHGDIPKDLPEAVSVIEIPTDRIYVVSSASMDFFLSLEALENVSFTSFDRNEVQDSQLLSYMDDKKIMSAGKYSAPDYELLLSRGCSLVVENTMISHSPGILDKFKTLKINTLIDYSSHESTPYGRMEWIKLYGIIAGKEQLAEEIFGQKEAALKGHFKETEKSVAYFYITDAGQVVIRKNQDYITKLIEIAGGDYIFQGQETYDGTGTMKLQKETFLEEVIDCDYLIYNSAISGELKDKKELAGKLSALEKTKAFKEGNVFCTTKNIYTSVMELPEIAAGLNRMLEASVTSDYFYQLK